MTTSFATAATQGFEYDNNKSAFRNLFDQYEIVICNSLFTSFGLDFLITDQHGGDVDTIHNVRKIGTDPEMGYKNAANAADYDNRGAYDCYSYHSDTRYKSRNREASTARDLGILNDQYTGKTIGPNESYDLDHVISGKEIHGDRGRVLSRLRGEDLANCRDNLQPTNRHTNRTKKTMGMDEFLEKRGYEYTPAEKQRMKQRDAEARAAYEKRIARAYYLSPKFASDVANAAGNVGLKMGLRQALGLLLAELWFSVKAEFHNLDSRFNAGHSVKDYFVAIRKAIKRWYSEVKNKRKELFARFKDGALAGALASVTTTLINIFATTAKNAVKIIRQVYVHVVDAAKVLFFNPDKLPLGERIKAVMKILAVGASVVAGTMVSEALAEVTLVPVLGEVVPTFCGALVSGILSCTLLFFFDRSSIVAKLVDFLNRFTPFADSLCYFKEQLAAYEKYAAELAKIDLALLREETRRIEVVADAIDGAGDGDALYTVLLTVYEEQGLRKPWGDADPDEFFSDRNNCLVFE